MTLGLKKLLFGAIVAIGMVGCYPNNEITVSEADIVATNYEEDYFATSASTTYFLVDTIGVIGSEDPEDQELTRKDMDEILDLVRKRLDDYGWIAIDPDTSNLAVNQYPDVVITVDNLVATNTGVGCIPWWGWNPWYPWWPGWGGGGWCYPTYLYSYTTGTLLIDMIDVEGSEEDELYIVWNGGINGLLRSSRAGNEDFIESNINQAFDQSPYLQRN